MELKVVHVMEGPVTTWAGLRSLMRSLEQSPISTLGLQHCLCPATRNTSVVLSGGYSFYGGMILETGLSGMDMNGPPEDDLEP